MTKKKVIGAVVYALVGLAVCAFIPAWYYGHYTVTNVSKPSGDDNGGGNQTVKVTDLDIKLKEGVHYFNNKLAAPKADDFEVTAKFSDETTQTLESDAYQMSIATDFVLNGGDINFTYRGFKKSITLELEAVVVSKLNIIKAPGKINYQIGETFDPYLMEVQVEYNDGSVKSINQKTETEEGYVISNDDFSQLTSDTTQDVKITYVEGDVTVENNVTVNIYKKLDNGNLLSIMGVDNGFDTSLSLTENLENIQVLGTYENGNTLLLSSDGFNLETNDNDSLVSFGKYYSVTITSKENTSIKTTLEVSTKEKIEAEDATAIGKNAPVVKEENGVKGIFNFNVEKYGVEDSNFFELQIYSDSIGDGSITMQVSNGFCVNDGNGNSFMQPLQISSVLDVTINDNLIDIGDEVILSGVDKVPENDYAKLYGIYVPVTLDNVHFNMGLNTIRFQMKPSTLNQLTRWGESPVMNFDYIVAETKGTVFDEASIKSLSFASNNKVVEVDDASKELEVKATLNDGSIVTLADKYLSYSINDEAYSGTVPIGDTKITASLLSNNKISTSKTVEFYSHFDAGDNDITLVGGKINSNEVDAESGQKVTVFGNFNTDTHPEDSLSFKINVGTQGDYDLFSKLSNGYYLEFGTDKKFNKLIPINQIADVYLDDVIVSNFISDNVKLFGVNSDNASSTICFNTYYVKRLGTFKNLTAGEHTVKFKFKNSKAAGYTNTWEEGIVSNISYFEVKKSHDYAFDNVSSIAFSNTENLTISSGAYLYRNIYPSVIATYKDGSTEELLYEDLEFSLDTSDEYATSGSTYVVTVKLAGTNITASTNLVVA